jgi:5-methylcytosine-specific restriction endonuclease McrA
MPSTLVLNADYTPLSIIPISSISWKDAIKISFLGHAQPVEYYEDWMINSPSISLMVPSVLISETYIKKKHGVRFSRTNLLIRDNFTCQYCEKKLNSFDLTVDHVIPRVKGGKTKWENIVCACYTCNTIKGHRNKMKPIKIPVKPEYWHLLDNARKMPIKIPSETWLKYLGWNESLVTVIKPDRN